MPRCGKFWECFTAEVQRLRALILIQTVNLVKTVNRFCRGRQWYRSICLTLMAEKRETVLNQNSVSNKT